MIVSDDTSLGRRPDVYGPASEGGEMFGFPPEGNVLKARGEDDSAEVFGMGALALEAHVPLLIGSIAAFAAGSALMIFSEKPGHIYLGDTLSFLGLIGALVSVRLINR